PAAPPPAAPAVPEAPAAAAPAAPVAAAFPPPLEQAEANSSRTLARRRRGGMMGVRLRRSRGRCTSARILIDSPGLGQLKGMRAMTRQHRTPPGLVVLGLAVAVAGCSGGAGGGSMSGAAGRAAAGA